LVIIGGLAELFSGAISMGLGAFLACVTDREKYLCEEQREIEEVRTKPQAEKDEIYTIMQQYGVGHDACTPLVEALAANEDQWVRVCMSMIITQA
jgi:VIT1/CCC1 family predicted Fe2+/Mn2+ transporter